MKAMLLTAGMGQRMGPLSLSQPKPTLPVLGRPLVVQLLHWLAGLGVGEAVLNLHHLPDAIRHVLRDGENPGLPEIHYSHEETILGTGGGIRQAGAALCGDGPIVVCNADFLADIDLAAALRAHRDAQHLATLVLAPWRPGYSVVRHDGRGSVRSLSGEAPPDPAQANGSCLYTGCQIIDEELIERIPTTGPSCIVRDVLRPLCAEGRLGGWLHEGFWWEFGSPELYLDGCLALLSQPRSRLNRIAANHDPIYRVDEADAAVGPGADLDDEARLVGRVAVGYGSHVAAGARIEDAVVMPEAWIGPGCRIRRSIVARGVELPAGFAADRLLICADPGPSVTLPPGTRREGELLVHPLHVAAEE